ncbi:MAG: family N-acetyltransferase [Herminiimonas sp.]|nr:family N-acetyltransferase [Herminiimonas sp.]MDB5855540.1 family N-acetyltransferase [Herminiimonas sp.]
MSIRNLQQMFAPRSVALIGASQRPHSVGATVLRNLNEGGFKGAIFPVNPKHAELAGLRCWPDVTSLPETPELAVICTPPATVPAIIRELGMRGTRAAIVLTAGLGARYDDTGRTVKQAMLDEANPWLLRILGPNCVGLLVPGIGLNASFAHTGALPGGIAFVSQSGALVTGVLDWAKSRGIGFSRFVSLGESADVDFGDVLDFLASDIETRAILLYVEDIRHARKFMSAARAAARSKPTLIVKSGRAPEGAKAAASHTGALAGSDDVYDAAIRRAGMLRVLTTEDLFGAVETLAHAHPAGGERLAIMTNGGGPGVMATDALICDGGKLATLSKETLGQLDQLLPATWSHGNPVDIIGDAPAERYVQSLEVLLKDPQADAILFIHAPTAIVPSVDIANAIVPLAKAASRNILACWLGGDAVAQARQLFAQAGIPTFDTPEEAVRGFMQIVQYRRNQQLLMQVPPANHVDLVPDPAASRATVKKVIQSALADGRDLLSEPESKVVLAAFGIPVVETRIVSSVEEAVRVAPEIGFPVAIKVLSPDISHKTDVGGVALDIESVEAVREAAEGMNRRVSRMRPDARLEGFAVQAMARRPEAQELIVGLTTDPVFGPVILFGAGGIAVELTADHAIGLPPLNMVLARDMVSRTRVARLLGGYRGRPPADIDAICRVLVQVAQLAIDMPEIIELDINPLLADSRGVLALDARIKIAACGPDASGLDRLAIRPYPVELEQWIEWDGQPLLLRPIKPEDGEAHIAFFAALDPEDVRLRMFTGMRELQPAQLMRFTQIDYDREMAFIATRKRADGESETLGVARAISDPDNERAEFAVVVRSDLKGRGLGPLLMKRLIDYSRSHGTGELVGEVLAYNSHMLRMMTRFGFDIKPIPGEGTMQLRLALRQSS